MLRILTVAALAGALFLPSYSPAADLEPPERTQVSGRLVSGKDKGAPAGVAYFVFQRRLLEIPQENPVEALRQMAEAAVAIDEDGSFTLKMAPGNYVLVYEPAAQLDPASLAPGPQSFARQQRLAPEQVKERIARIQENARQGLPIEKGQVGDAYVVENRFVRPPVTDFGEIPLGDPHTVTVLAQDVEGNPAEFPLSLRMRGKNGDVYEPHPPTVSEKGKFVFHDVFPQPYQLFGLPSKPAPGQGDEPTTPTVANGDLLFTGEPLTWTIKVDPNPPAEETAEPELPAGARRSGAQSATGEESAIPRKRTR